MDLKFETGKAISRNARVYAFLKAKTALSRSRDDLLFRVMTLGPSFEALMPDMKFLWGDGLVVRLDCWDDPSVLAAVGKAWLNEIEMWAFTDITGAVSASHNFGPIPTFYEKAKIEGHDDLPLVRVFITYADNLPFIRQQATEDAVLSVLKEDQARKVMHYHNGCVILCRTKQLPD